jgi:hypothetical protein
VNCKPGDLAYVVKRPFGGPVGVVVEVESFEEIHPVYGFLWVCRSKTPLPTIGLGFRCDVIVADDWLRPITGLPITEDIKDEVTA